MRRLAWLPLLRVLAAACSVPASSSGPPHALAESRVQHMRPYGVNEAATPLPIRIGPSPARAGPSAAHARRMVSPSIGSLSSTWPVAMLSPFRRKFRSRTSSGSMPRAAASASIWPS